MDPAKVNAVKDMPFSTSKSELQTVLGMITYIQRFAQSLAEMTSPLRQLLPNPNPWSCSTLAILDRNSVILDLQVVGICAC